MKGNEEAEVDKAAGVGNPVQVGTSAGLGNLVGEAERASHKEHQDLDLGYNKQEGDSYEPVQGKWYEFPFLLEL